MGPTISHDREKWVKRERGVEKEREKEEKRRKRSERHLTHDYDKRVC